MTRIETFHEVSEYFELVDTKLVYVDAPLEGLVRTRAGELFAFRCAAVVPGCLWHWVLLPAHSVEDSVEDVFERARSVPPAQWVSIVEDRRGPQPCVSAAWLDSSSHPVPRWPEPAPDRGAASS
jgi:hypothetical protein